MNSHSSKSFIVTSRQHAANATPTAGSIRSQLSTYLGEGGGCVVLIKTEVVVDVGRRHSEPGESSRQALALFASIFWRTDLEQVNNFAPHPEIGAHRSSRSTSTNPDSALQPALQSPAVQSANPPDSPTPTTTSFRAINVFGPAVAVSLGRSLRRSKVRTGKKTFLLVFLLSKKGLAELLRFPHFCWRFVEVERVKGIEPSSQAWEAHILPLNHTRTGLTQLLLPKRSCGGNPRFSRTRGS